MWRKIASLILRNRLYLLAITLLLTGFFGYFIYRDLKLDTRYGVILPSTHPAQIHYKKFENQFGEEGNTLVIAISSKDLYTEKKFHAWQELGEKINRIDGVESVLSEARLFYLENNKVKKKFVPHRILYDPKKNKDRSIEDVKNLIKKSPFFEGLLYNDSSHVSLMLVEIDKTFLEDKHKSKVVLDIESLVDSYAPTLGKISYSGLPHIRVSLAKRILNEMYLFLGLSLLASVVLIFYLFKSVRIILLCGIVLGVSIVWALGMTALLGYPLTAMMALVPPLLVIIGIPHIVYIITCYHQEFVKTKNNVKALMVTTRYIGPVTLLMNLTTAVGFVTFTSSERVTEFGIISSVNVMVLFLLTLYLVPIFMSYFGKPKEKHMRHLTRPVSHRFVNFIMAIVTKRRRLVYFLTIILIAVGVWGATKIFVTGNVLGDVSQKDPISKDLRYLEHHFGGSIPFEIVIDLADSKDVMNEELMVKVEKIQQFLKKDTLFSKSISNVDLIKFANMAYHNNNPKHYVIPKKSNEKQALLKYYEASKEDFSSFSNGRFSLAGLDNKERKPLRIRLQIKDIGSFDMLNKISVLERQVDSILNPEFLANNGYLEAFSKGRKSYFDSLMLSGSIKNGLIDAYSLKHPEFLNSLTNASEEDQNKLIQSLRDKSSTVETLKSIVRKQRNEFHFTGISVVVAEGTKYLIMNLWEGLLFSFLMITLLMVFLFRSFSIFLATMIPNIIPLILTAGIMGYFKIPLKPSTVMIFGIALGITVNDTILLLGKLKQKIKENPTISRIEALMQALEESALAMAYTSIILIFGFIMFVFSNFLGTQALGLLISITLLIGMFTNLILLPSLMLSFHKKMNYQRLIESEVFNEEDDYDEDKLELEKPKE